MSGFFVSHAGSAPPLDTVSEPPRRAGWRGRMSLAGVLVMGASMAVVGVTSTAAQADPNIALNQTATGSPACYGAPGATAAAAVDGAPNTKWCSVYTGGNRTLEVDFGAVQNIRQFVVEHAGAGGENPIYNTRLFKIYTRASAGDSWTQQVSVTDNTANKTTHTISVASARYAKLEIPQYGGTQTGSDFAARIPEFEAYQYSAGTNLAYNAIATSSATSCNGSETPVKAVDESTSTKWCSTSATRELEVDLGMVEDVRQFVVKHAGAGGESASYNTRKFKIYTRVTTGDSWAEKVSVTANTANTSTHDVPPTFARYLKLEVIDGTQSGSGGAARVYEFEATRNYTNLAFQAPTSLVHGSGCDNGVGNPPANAVDGNLTTKWCDSSEWQPVLVFGEWTLSRVADPTMKVDLGATKTVTGIRVYHAQSGGESSSLNTKHFNVSGDVSGSFNSGTINESVTSATVNITGRYITLAAGFPEQTSYMWDKARIYEFEVFGY